MKPIFLNRRDGFKVKDGSSRFVGFLQVEREVQRPVVEVVGIDEGLVDGGAVFGNVGVAGVAKTILEISCRLGNLDP